MHCIPNVSMAIHIEFESTRDPTIDTMSVLCLGPKYSGKTHLLTKLSKLQFGEDATSPHIVPTIGTNIFSIKLPVKQKTTSKQKSNVYVQVREVGGTMAPMWKNYLTDAKKLMYVVDTSNLCQISAAGINMSSNFIHSNSLHKNDISRCPFIFTARRSSSTTRESVNCADKNGFGIQTDAK